MCGAVQIPRGQEESLSYPGPTRMTYTPCSPAQSMKMTGPTVDNNHSWLSAVAAVAANVIGGLDSGLDICHGRRVL